MQLLEDTYLTQRRVPCSFAVMPDRSDIPFGKWCIPEYGGIFLKLKNLEIRKGVPKVPNR